MKNSIYLLCFLPSFLMDALYSGTDSVAIVLNKAEFCYKAEISAVNTFLISPSPSEIDSQNITIQVISKKGDIGYKMQNDSLYLSLSGVANKFVNGSYSDSLTIKMTCDGKVYQKTEVIKVNALPKVQWRRIDPVCWSNNDVPLNPFVIEPKDLNNIFITSDKTPGIVVKNTSTNPNQWTFKRSTLDNEALNKQAHSEQLTLIYTDTNGCASTESTNITVNGNPRVQLRDRVYCQDKGEALMDSLILIPKVFTGLRLEWKVLDGPFTNVLQNKGFPPKTWMIFGSPQEEKYAGNYKMQLCVSNSITGCTTCADTNVRIINEPKIEISQPAPVCVNGDTMDLLNYFVLNGAKPKVGDGVVSVEQSPFGAINTILTKGHFFFPGWGRGIWEFKYSSAITGCLNEKSFFLNVIDTPNAVLLPNRIMCENEVALDINSVLDQVNSKGIASTKWTGPRLNNDTFTPLSSKVARVEGPYVLTLEARNAQGCIDYEYYQIRVRTLPEISILNARPGQVVGKNAFTLNANAKFDNGVQWETILGSNGYFKNPSAQNTDYIHGSVDENRRYAWVKVSTIPLSTNEVCPQASDSIEITFVGGLGLKNLALNSQFWFNTKLEVINGDFVKSTSVYSINARHIATFENNQNPKIAFTPGVYVVLVYSKLRAEPFRQLVQVN